jgi:MFS family permease
LCFSVGAIGAVLGSLLTVPLARRLGSGPATVVSAAVACCGLLLLVPLEGAGPVAPLLAAALFVRGLGLTGWNVQIRSLQQTLVPHRLLGRMNAAYLLLSYGAGAVGALAGGLAGGVVGLRTVLVVSAVGVSLAWFWLAASPLRTLRPHRAARADGPPDPGGS